MDLLVKDNLKPGPELYKMTLDPNIPDLLKHFRTNFQ